MSNAPGIRINPRTLEVQKAEHAIVAEIEDASAAYELTTLELLQILFSFQQRVVKYALRSERHPGDRDKGADEE